MGKVRQIHLKPGELPVFDEGDEPEDSA